MKRPALTFLNSCTWIPALVAVACADGLAQADFQIVWVAIGEVSAPAADESVRAGRHLFMARDLAALSLKHIEVARVDVQPTIVQLAPGEQFCVTSLSIGAFNAAAEPVRGAPLTISVRQDHKEAMGLDRRRKDICVKPVRAGEYPLRFASLLPAKDGTTRGAQVFIRVRDAAPE